MTDTLLSSDKAPHYQASKWLHFPLLCDVSELESLFLALGEIKIVALSGVNAEGDEIIPLESFFNHYNSYLNLIKTSEELPSSQLHRWFTSGLSLQLNHFCKIPVGENENIIRIVKPVLQIKPHWFSYSDADQKIRIDTLSLNNISWGLQFSYPQLFEDPQTKNVHKVLKENFPNNEPFKNLQKWIRVHTQATPFLVENRKINAPIRIGKACLPWIDEHKGLIKKGIKVNV